MKKQIFLIAVIFCLTVPFSFAQGGAAIGSILNQLEDTAEEILNDVDYTFNHSVNNATVNVLNSIQQFKDAYSEILDKTVDELTGQQRMAFEGVENNINNVFRNIRETNKQLDNSVNNLALHIGHIIPGGKTPRITLFSSPIVVRKGQKDILVTFHGVFLNNGSNHLEIGRKKIYPLEHTDKTLKFAIPANNLLLKSTSRKVLFAKIKLRCYYKNGFIIKRTKRKDYKFLIKTVPSHLADITLYYDLEKAVTKRAKRAEQFKVSVKSGSFSGFPPKANFPKDKRQSFIVKPRNGWLIDVLSIELKCGGNSSCNSNCSTQIENKTSSGFLVNMYARTDTKPKVWCHYKCTVTFDEYRTGSEVYKENRALKIFSGKSESIDLPTNTKHFRKLEVKLFNGKTLVFNKPSTEDVIKVDYNPVTKLLTIIPLI